MMDKANLKQSNGYRLMSVYALTLCSLITGFCDKGLAQESPGSILYNSGDNAKAILLNGKAKVPGSRFPCANCHGEDGMGSREGATVMPPVSWQFLSQSTPRRPAYTIESFKHALTQGVSANGKNLGELMPRYETSPQILDKLVEYLKILDADQRTGITNRFIKIAAPESLDARVGYIEAARRFNDEGGSYGRMLATVKDEQHFINADNLASIVEEQLGPAIQNQLLESVVTDGITTVALMNGPPEAEFGHRLSIAGIEYDEVAPTLLVIDRSTVDISKIERWFDRIHRDRPDAIASLDMPLRIYAPVSALAPYMEKIHTKLHEIVLVDLDESAVRWAMANKQSANSAFGFAVGTLIGEALLTSGRDLTRHAVFESIKKINLQSRLFIWRSSTEKQDRGDQASAM